VMTREEDSTARLTKETLRLEIPQVATVKSPAEFRTHHSPVVGRNTARSALPSPSKSPRTGMSPTVPQSVDTPPPESATDQSPAARPVDGQVRFPVAVEVAEQRLIARGASSERDGRSGKCLREPDADAGSPDDESDLPSPSTSPASGMSPLVPHIVIWTDWSLEYTVTRPSRDTTLRCRLCHRRRSHLARRHPSARPRRSPWRHRYLRPNTRRRGWV
jgi:hypothetical protein